MAFSAFKSNQEIKRISKQNNDIEYIKKGLLVINSLKNKNLLMENIKMLRSLGIKAEYLENKQLNKINPYIKTENSYAGFDPEAGYVNSRLVVDYLKNQCENLGVKIIENTKVLNIRLKKKIFYIRTNKGELKAAKVFNATAAYSNKINSFFDFQLPIKIVKTNNCFYRLPMGPQRFTTAIADFVNLFYIIPHKEFIDVSSLTVDLKKQVNPEDKNIYRLDENASKQYLNIISKRIKNAEKSSLLGGFGSCIDISPDYYPILGKIDEVPNFYCATGFSGTGFKHFPMIGILMAETILEKKPTYPNLVSYFNYKRFEKEKEKERKKVTDSYFVKK